MKHFRLLYIFVLILTFNACLDDPTMTDGIINGELKPVVENDGYTNEENDSQIIIKGIIIPKGKGTIIRKGFCWAVAETESINNNESFDPEKLKYDTILSFSDTNEFSAIIKYTGDTTYWWRAFAQNEFGYTQNTKLDSYNSPKINKDRPKVETLEPYIPKITSLLLKAEIIPIEGGREVTRKGFCWASIESEKVNGSFDPESLEYDTIIINDNNSIYSIQKDNLQGGKVYYWKAFAENYYGISIGKTKSYKSPDIWAPMTELNGAERARGATFTLFNKFYYACGEKESTAGIKLLEDMWAYTPSIQEDGKGSWNQTTDSDFKGAARRYPVAFTIRNVAFVGTGEESSSNIFNNFYAFDGSKWHKKEIKIDDMLGRAEAVGFSLNNKGYVVGGRYGSNISPETLNDVWQYTYLENQEPEDGIWKKMNDFPQNFYGGICISGKDSEGNDRIFVGLGTNDNSSKILWEYEEANDSWIEFVDGSVYPEEMSKRVYSGTLIQDKIYIVDAKNVIWTLDINTKEWERKTELPSVFFNDKVLPTMPMYTKGTSIYLGLNFSKFFYRYEPLWDN